MDLFLDKKFPEFPDSSQIEREGVDIVSQNAIRC